MEEIIEYDEHKNIVHRRYENGIEWWYKFDKNNKMVYCKSNNGFESWYKYDENNEQIGITQKEYEWIEFKKKEKEFNSRTPVSRFQLMDI